MRVGEPLAPEGDARTLTRRLGEALLDALGDRAQDPEGDRSHAIVDVPGGVEGRERDGTHGNSGSSEATTRVDLVSVEAVPACM